MKATMIKDLDIGTEFLFMNELHTLVGFGPGNWVTLLNKTTNEPTRQSKYLGVQPIKSR